MHRPVVAVILAVGFLVLACGKKGETPEAQSVAPLPDASMPPVPKVTKPGLWIVEPQDGSQVEHRPYVTGTISDTTVQEVWVVVRPIEGDGYWVQPQAILRTDGAWMSRPFIGLADTPSGASFKLRAFVRPMSGVKSGDRLDDWPEAELVSNQVIVKR